MEIERIRKRSWEIENYNLDKIIRAAYKWLESVWNKDLKDAQRVAEKVDLFLKKECEEKEECIPSVEHIQDIVERVLMELWFYDAAKSYILYRESKIKERLYRSNENKTFWKHWGKFQLQCRCAYL